MNKNTIPDDFTMGLALFDALPVLFFGISVILLGVAMKSPLFVIGAALSFAAGAAKVLWKIIVVKKRKNVWWLFIQMRILMPIGFVLMILAFVFGRGNKETAWILKAATELPVSACLLAGLFGMILMGIFGFALNSADKKSNWIEQITNCLAQLVIMFGVILLVYGASFYPAGEKAVTAIAPSDTVTLHAEDKELAFEAKESDTGFIFYPGAKVEYTAYAPLMKELSEEGITCVIVRMPLNMAFFGSSRALDIMEEYPEIKHWYIGGHSLGGVAAGAFAAKHEGAVEGMILLASYTTKDMGELPVLSVYGTEDQVINRGSYEKYHSNIDGDLTEVEISGGNHAQFADYGFQKGDGEAKISAEEQWEITKNAILEFVR